MSLALLQIGLPGTQEMFIVAIMFLFMLALPVVGIALIVKYFAGDRGADDERIEELEREVEELRNERETAAGEPDDELQ